jgi:predicted RNA binding protein YcfA (HicA-like mRNA interferase family)
MRSIGSPQNIGLLMTAARYPIHGDELATLLAMEAGFTAGRQQGSHLILESPRGGSLSIPRRDLGKRLYSRILLDAADLLGVSKAGLINIIF